MFGSKIVSLQNSDFQLRQKRKTNKEKQYSENKLDFTHFRCKGLALHYSRDILKNGQLPLP